MRKQIKRWLKGNDTYTFHHSERQAFSRSRVIAYGMVAAWPLFGFCRLFLDTISRPTC